MLPTDSAIAPRPGHIDRTAATFGGATVAQFESRRAGDLEGLVRRHGGIAWSAPALSEVPLADDAHVAAALEQLTANRFDIVVLLTGVGTRLLLEAAVRAGVLADARTALTQATTICRGPKPAFTLKQHGLKPTHLVPEPHTTPQLISVLATLPLAGARTLIVSAGEQMEEPIAFLRQQHALAVEIQLYRWDLTRSDAAGLVDVIHAIVAGRVDAAAFTTQVQVRHLFNVAAGIGQEQQLALALRTHVVVGAVGPTCAEALRARGVEPDVVPEHPKMGHLVVALAAAVARRRDLANVATQDALASSVTDYVHAVLRGTAICE